MENSLITVLLADDHELVRAGIRSLLATIDDIKVLPEEASDGEKAIELARRYKPDVVLMDLKMPGVGGLEATRRLKHFCPDAQILIVTTCNREPLPSRLMQAGAAGYITKDSGLQEVEQAIRTVFSGKRYISPDVAQEILNMQWSENKDNPLDVLSDRELQIMLMIANGIKATQIAEKLALTTKTVNTYRYRIFSKLDISNDVELTHTAIRYGLLSEDMQDQ